MPRTAAGPLNRADIDAAPELRMLAESDVAGPMLLSTESGRQIFVIGTRNTTSTLWMPSTAAM